VISRLDHLFAAAKTAPVVPVLVVPSAEGAANLAHALIDGGLLIAEVTLRTAAGPAVIEAMKRAEPGLVVGAGTVLTGADVTSAMSAGADFLVSPGMTDRLLAALGSARAQMIPGIATASEAMARHEEGFALLKLFPAAVAGGVAALKALSGPLPMLQFMPTGGITEANAADYLAVSNVVAVGGSWIASPAEIEAGDWKGISERARRAANLQRL
jgi:2-dehydro-3-deoxyphosphogluconate aldolase / (4S)-4-hydroxy-2-oxoglutarate aldolase